MILKVTDLEFWRENSNNVSNQVFFRVCIILLSGIFVVYWATVSGQV